MAKRTNSREAILEAADALILEKGVHALTIDSVAAMTGLGKGGVLYHFKYKVDLLHGLIERHCERWDKMVREGTAQAGGDIYAWMNYLVEFTLKDQGEMRRVGVAIIAAAAGYPELLEPIRRLYEQRHRYALSQMSDPHLAAIIVLAMDGFAFFDAISISPIDDTLMDGVKSKMIDLIEEMRKADTGENS